MGERERGCDWERERGVSGRERERECEWEREGGVSGREREGV